ncbi:DH domain-containing protein [Mycena indigotica]|uniref:DH domain-containing protein n=1 Tax=Mycena indigotica TaxID=2126181 RepID=A0A8H6RYG5_9AGAR|nr:DH domain-containing protein [Mycena indigotica]KAF7289243.1 DH domain-containing protein [Mycena indigotica]
MEAPPPPPPPRSPLRPPPTASTTTIETVLQSTATTPEPTLSKRQHALHELLSSERAYASDLTLILEVHIPLAQGPMTPDDIKIIFGNIGELAELSDAFCEALERTMGSALEKADATDDRIGELFLRYAPEVEGPYKQYITRHPSALAHLTALPTTPELTAYHAKTRDLASSLSHAWDLASLLIKPVQRLLKYSLLLGAIIDATQPTHPDRPHLVNARTKIEEVAHAVNEGRRRAEVVKEVLNAPKKPPTVLRIKSFRAPADVNSEAARVDRMASELARIDVFAQQLSRGAQEWARAADASTHALLTWARAFAAAIGLSSTVRSEAFDAFLTTLVEGLVPVAAGLLPKIASDLLAPLARLLATTTQPRQLLASMNENAPLHHHLLTMTVSAKNRPPPALMEASARYLALRTQLAAEFPEYLTLLHRGLAALVRRLAAVQAAFFFDSREVWAGLWDMLRVEGERNGGGEETVAVWTSRWGDVDQGIQTLKICQPLTSGRLSIPQTVVVAPPPPPPPPGALSPAAAYARAHAYAEPINTDFGTTTVGSIGSNTLFESPTYVNGHQPPSPHYERKSSGSASFHSGSSTKAPSHVSNALASLEPANRRSAPASSSSAAGAFMQASHNVFSPQMVSGPYPLSPSHGRPRGGSDATNNGWTGFPGWNAPTTRGKSPGRVVGNGAIKANAKVKRSNSPTPTSATAKTAREGGAELGEFVSDLGWDYGGMILPPKKMKDVEREEEKAREKAKEKEKRKEKKEEEEREKARKKEEKSKQKKSNDVSSRLALLEGGGYGTRDESRKKPEKDKGMIRRASDLTHGNSSSGKSRTSSATRPSSRNRPPSVDSFIPYSAPRPAPLPPGTARGRSRAPSPDQHLDDDDFRARHSTWLAAPVQYSCRVVHPCTPPSAVSYFGFPFFALEEHAILGVLHEAGHPSTHPRLPLYVDDGADCLLLCRDSANEIGWALASFLAPLAAD